MSIQLERSGYAPGESVHGRVEAEAPVRLRLFWYTEGKGTRDAGIAAEAAPDERGAFALALPTSPYSCSGRLLSIRWAVEVVDAADNLVERADLVMGPNRAEVLLGEPEAG